MAEQKRYRLLVRYDGTDFSGSQIQPGRLDRATGRLVETRTVSGTLKAGLEQLLSQPLRLFWAGRTDAGVHANCNVCVFDCSSRIPAEVLPKLVNAVLPCDLWVVASDSVERDWHPRFTAVSRTYRYRLWTSEEVPYDKRRFVWHRRGDLDLQGLSAMLSKLRGRHDFASLSRLRPASGSTQCEIYCADVVREGPELRFLLEADRFLWQMVRKIVGLCVELAAEGNGEQMDLLQLSSCRKFRAAPPAGLVLEGIKYPDFSAGL